MNSQRTLANCIRAEFLKLRNTLALVVSIGVPFFICFINWLIYLSDGDKIVQAGKNPWPGYIWQLQNFWAGLLLPLTIILTAALINALEHTNNTWKRVYAFPVEKGSIYFSKLFVFLLLNVVTCLSLIIFTQVFGSTLVLLRPALGFNLDSHVGTNIHLIFKMMLASSVIIGFQFLLSFRFKSFVIPMVIGFCITVGAGIAGRWQHIDLIPYAYPALSIAGQALTFWDKYVILSLVIFVIISVIGSWESSTRDIY